MRFYPAQVGLGFGTPVTLPDLSDEVTATDAMGLAAANLRSLLAQSSTFQTAIGATGTGEEKQIQAKSRIHLTAYEPVDGQFERPFALITHSGNDRTNAFGGDSGDLELVLVQAIPDKYADEPANAEAYFTNFAGGCRDDCIALSGIGGNFGINHWEVLEGPSQYEAATGVWEYAIKIMINWGLE